MMLSMPCLHSNDDEFWLTSNNDVNLYINYRKTRLLRDVAQPPESLTSSQE